MNAEIKIERVGQDGQGIGYDSDRNIYFVPNTVPGDRVQVSYHQSKRYRDAELVSLLEASPHRQEVPCEIFQECGGAIGCIGNTKRR